jgi:alkyl hydroperoxide reductase subunit AhpC
MGNLEAHRGDFESRNAVALGLSIDTVPSKKAWAEEMGVENTQLLSDHWPHGEVARNYGIFREGDGFSERAVFVVDQEGVVQWKKVYPIGEQPDVDEILTAVEKA